MDILLKATSKKRKNSVDYLSGWFIDWERGLAYKALNESQWEQYDRYTGKSKILSEIDLPYYVKEVVLAPSDK